MLNDSALRLPQLVNEPGIKRGWVLSCLLHGALLAFIIIGWHPPEKEIEAVRPRYIQAELLQMKPPLEQPAKPAPQPEAKPQPAPKPAVDQEAMRRAEEQKRQEQQKQEQQKKEEQAKAEAEKVRQEQVRKEQEAKAEAEKKRQAAEAEKKRQEQQKKEEQAKAEAEKKRQEEQRKELARQEQLKREQAEKRRQEELANALAMEDDMRAAEASAAQVGTYVDYMASLIASNWSRPPSARRGMEVMLEISLGAAGVVTNVRVVKSSGNSAFDLSAEQAVRKVGQFSRLREMDPAIYQREFRRINILFRPDDLRM